jgi:hypothetical protein
MNTTGLLTRSGRDPIFVHSVEADWKMLRRSQTSSKALVSLYLSTFERSASVLLTLRFCVLKHGGDDDAKK